MKYCTLLFYISYTQKYICIYGSPKINTWLCLKLHKTMLLQYMYKIFFELVKEVHLNHFGSKWSQP